MAKYRKKPVEVEAARWEPNNMAQPHPSHPDSEGVVWQYDAEGEVFGGTIITPNRDIVIHPGDWIIRIKSQPSITVCSDEVFAATYERVED